MYSSPPDSPPLLQRVEVRPQPSPEPNIPPPPLPTRTDHSSPSAGTGRHRGIHQKSTKVECDQSDAVIISFLGNLNRPDLAQAAWNCPLSGDSSDEAETSSSSPPPTSSTSLPPPRSEMTAAYEQSSVHHLNPHVLGGPSSHHPLRQDNMSSTRPRSGGSAHLSLIMNRDNSLPPVQTVGSRLDTLQPTLAQSSIGAHVLSGPVSSTSSRSPRTAPTLPPPGALMASLSRELPPPPRLGTTSTLPSPIPDLASSVRPTQLPSIGNQLSVTTPPPSYRSHPSPTTSLRSPLQGVHSAVSPPSHFSSIPPARSKPLSPQSEATTPASAFSSASFHSQNGSMTSGGDPMQLDGGRLTLPPLPTAPGMNTPGVVFRCKHPGCTAPSFQTQYLLNSHMNVHSSSRPHYCPRKGCPRGEGGKGFKRKNEMIRHGLVHQSPGYACPFCPDREHKYPRPDNLQRHVKVHHVDKEKDDPVLRDVLNQRLDGGSRGRRRRANS